MTQTLITRLSKLDAPDREVTEADREQCKELIALVAEAIIENPPVEIVTDDEIILDWSSTAKAAISIIRVALQEPNEAMKEAWDLDTGRWISEEIEDPYHPWRVMLAASTLGEQSE